MIAANIALPKYLPQQICANPCNLWFSYRAWFFNHRLHGLTQIFFFANFT
jgi:hypothetical protein